MERLVENSKDLEPPGWLSLPAGFLFAISLWQLHFAFSDFALSAVDAFTYLLLSIGTTLLWTKFETAKTRGQSLLGAVSIPFLFPFGTVISSALLVLNALAPPPAEGRGELGQDEFVLFRLKPDPKSKPRPDLKEEFLPAVSLLESEDIDTRRAAIDVLAEIGGPAQIELLQSCLDDPEREVYQYAHAKLTGLHERHTKRIQEAQESGNRQALLDRYLEYIGSGLLGGATSDFYRQKAISVAGKLLEETPDSLPILTVLGKLYVDQNSPTEATLVLNKALEREPNSVEARWEMARLAYTQQNFREMRDHLQHLKLPPALHETPISQTVRWWLSEIEDS